MNLYKVRSFFCCSSAGRKEGRKEGTTEGRKERGGGGGFCLLFFGKLKTAKIENKLKFKQFKYY